MQYVQVKILQSWKIAAFLVAFFSSFFSYSSVDYTKLDGRSPKIANGYTYTCKNDNNSTLGQVFIEGTFNIQSAQQSCHSMQESDIEERLSSRDCPATGGHWETFERYVIYQVRNTWDCSNTLYEVTINYVMRAGEHEVSDSKSCPPDSHPSFTHPSFDSEGVINLCYHPNDVESQINEENELDKNEDYCKSLALDSGNNSAQSMCYTAYNGSSCSVSKVTVGDASYYKGTGNNPLGCGSTDEPNYDSSGTGSDKDGCIYSGGTNYCKADEDKHCSSISGSKICDDGCIDDGSNVFCDVERHNDVGEGESDYHDGKGSCSVTSASSSKGFCEDSGGDWDSTAPDENNLADCNMASGSCSVGGASFCGQCLDDGGVWTPDEQIPQSQEKTGLDQVAHTIQDGNNKLTQIESGIRSTTESTISTMKSGNGKIVAAIEELTKIVKDKPTGGGATEEEKETFTTTTGDIDKTKINALFDDASKAAIEAEIDQLKIDTTSFINSARSEASSLMSITVPTLSGYESRNLTLTQGSFDLSLNRFSTFFTALSGAVMMVCSILAGFILLGGKD